LWARVRRQYACYKYEDAGRLSTPAILMESVPNTSSAEKWRCILDRLDISRSCGAALTDAYCIRVGVSRELSPPREVFS
jgi:hypothetical protein